MIIKLYYLFRPDGRINVNTSVSNNGEKEIDDSTIISNIVQNKSINPSHKNMPRTIFNQGCKVGGQGNGGRGQQ